MTEPERTMSDSDETTQEPTPDETVAQGTDPLQAAQSERDANHEKWLRAEAELVNFRNRTRKELEELIRFQSLPLTRDLLPALDNLNRAIAAAEGSGNIDELLQGIRMVAQQFRDALTKQGVETIECVNQPFDPNLHEAVQQIPSADHPPMTVLQDLETGYKLHDRVIRPSKVIVSAAPPAETPSDDSAT